MYIYGEGEAMEEDSLARQILFHLCIYMERGNLWGRIVLLGRFSFIYVYIWRGGSYGGG